MYVSKLKIPTLLFDVLIFEIVFLVFNDEANNIIKQRYVFIL